MLLFVLFSQHFNIFFCSFVILFEVSIRFDLYIRTKSGLILNDFLKTFYAERVGISSRVSKPAICEPELKTVEIPAANDPSIIQFPRCVHLERWESQFPWYWTFGINPKIPSRCGGCCGSDLLTCEPTRSKQTEVQVIKLNWWNTLSLVYFDGKVVFRFIDMNISRKNWFWAILSKCLEVPRNLKKK